MKKMKKNLKKDVKTFEEEKEIEKGFSTSVSMESLKRIIDESYHKLSDAKLPEVYDGELGLQDLVSELYSRFGLGDWYGLQDEDDEADEDDEDEDKEEKEISEFHSPLINRNTKLINRNTNIMVKALTKAIEKASTQRGLISTKTKTKTKRKATEQEVEDFMTTETNPKEEIEIK